MCDAGDAIFMGGTDSPSGAPVPAVDPSWSTPAVALTSASQPQGAASETWAVIFKPDADPIQYVEGTPDEMLARYESLATGWTGVVLVKVLVPDAASAEFGESHRRFTELRASRSTPEPGQSERGEVETLLAEMAKQASLGHTSYCVGVHEGGEAEWIGWDAALRMLLAARATHEETTALREAFMSEHVAALDHILARFKVSTDPQAKMTDCAAIGTVHDLRSIVIDALAATRPASHRDDAEASQ